MKKLILLTAIILAAGVLAAQTINKPIIQKAVFFGKSKPIGEMDIVLPGEHQEKQEVIRNFGSREKGETKYTIKNPEAPKPILQRYQGTLKSKGPLLNFDGIGNVNGVYPADPNGDVSPDHYIQTVNMSFAVWDKSGNLLYGPVDNKTLWDGFPGPWTNFWLWSDPVFKYDRMADRWIISTMVLKLSTETYYTMLAVSETSDPLGAYYCYGYLFEKMNDYPKLSIWPNGYYITYNILDDGGWTFIHSLATVLDRDAMLAGEPDATVIEFEIPEPDYERFFPLPADFYGENIPSDLPCYIVNTDNHDPDNEWNLSLDIYAFMPDWETPENSTFEQVSQFEIGEIEPVVNFGPGAPQPGNDKNVMTIPVYMMYPLSYRAFDDHESMVCCHTLWTDSIHYLKWYELRKEDAGWYMYQTGNYSPDSTHRYQPSININANGDIAMGYTISDGNTFPSVRMTGRRAGDPPGEMTFQEIELLKGLNFINTYQSEFDANRWGDYASMMVDPANDTTFWFTNMYPTNKVTTGNWGTRIFSINLSEETEEPYVYAGPDTTICGYEDFDLHGEANNYSSLIWETSGDGWFTDNHQLITTYARGNGDLENGQSSLILTVSGYEPGTTVSDSMTLFLNKFPEVSAGSDDTLCLNESFTCHGEVLFSNEYYWTCTGNGTFNDSTLLGAIYSPALSDTALEKVVLSLHAQPLLPCTMGVIDELHLKIVSCLGISDYTAGIHLNVFPNPSGGLVTVETEQPGQESTTINILNARGQLIFTGIFPSKNGKLKKQFDFQMLHHGIYYISVMGENNIRTVQLIIQ